MTVSDLAPPGLTITGMSGSGWTCAALPVCAPSASLPFHLEASPVSRFGI